MEDKIAVYSPSYKDDTQHNAYNHICSMRAKKIPVQKEMKGDCFDAIR